MLTNRTRKLLDVLGEPAHDFWASWMKEQFSMASTHKDGTMMIPPETIVGWEKMIETPYLDLSVKPAINSRMNATECFAALACANYSIVPTNQLAFYSAKREQRLDTSLTLFLMDVLSASIHVSWSGWTYYLLSLCGSNKDGSKTIWPKNITPWIRKMNTPYSELSEEEQNSDRVEAHHWIDALEDAGYVIMPKEELAKA